MARPTRAARKLAAESQAPLAPPSAWADGGLSVRGACELVAMSRTMLDGFRLRGAFAWALVGTKVVIARRSLLEWLARHQQTISLGT